MKSFFETVKPTIDPGIYMCAKYCQQSQERIKHMQKVMGLLNPVSMDKLHTTVVYSKKTVDLFPRENISESASIVDIERWETKYGSTIVGMISSPYLEDRFKDAMDAGATYDYDTYKPHITLSYTENVDDIDVKIMKNRLNFPIELSIFSEEVEALDLDKTASDLSEHIEHRGDKWVILNHDRTKELGEYDSKEAAEKRLAQIEYFKHK